MGMDRRGLIYRYTYSVDFGWNLTSTSRAPSNVTRFGTLIKGSSNLDVLLVGTYGEDEETRERVVTCRYNTDLNEYECPETHDLNLEADEWFSFTLSADGLVAAYTTTLVGNSEVKVRWRSFVSDVWDQVDSPFAVTSRYEEEEEEREEGKQTERSVFGNYFNFGENGQTLFISEIRPIFINGINTNRWGQRGNTYTRRAALIPSTGFEWVDAREVVYSDSLFTDSDGIAFAYFPCLMALDTQLFIHTRLLYNNGEYAQYPPRPTLLVARYGPCPKGYECRREGSSTPCQEGHFCPPDNEEGTAETLMQLCPASTYCRPRSTSPTPCDLGSYCPLPQTALPLPCAAGFYCPSPTIRTRCEPGFYCPESSINMTACPDGTYCPDFSGTRADKCPLNYYCPNTTTIVECPGDFFALPVSQSLCLVQKTPLPTLILKRVLIVTTVGSQ